MKKFISCLVAAVTLMFAVFTTSCEKENGIGGSIIGEWIAVNGGDAFVICFEEDGSYWEYEIYDYGTDYEYVTDKYWGTYTLKGDKVHLVYGESGNDVVLKVRVSGNKLTVTESGSSVAITFTRY